MNEIFLRKYRAEDLPQLAELFQEAVRQTKEYSARQQEAWLGKGIDLEKWHQSLARHDTLVAVKKDQVIGFGDRSGDYFDRLYVSPGHQRSGAASSIAARLEENAQKEGHDRLWAEASLSAQDFFKSRGYETLWQQEVCRHGVWLQNARMEKRLCCKSIGQELPLFFRHAVAADAPLLVELQNRAFESDFMKFGYCPAYHADARKKAEKIAACQVETYVIQIGLEPVGEISISQKEQDDYFLGCLCLVPRWQGRGIGGKALKFLEAIKPGARRWSLVTPFEKKENLRFYRQNGFRVAEYAQDGPVKLAVLEKQVKRHD